MRLVTPCEGGACICLEDVPGRLVTPCDAGACIALAPAPGGLVLSSNQTDGTVLVTADEVRKFATAVQAGFFDELLGGGLD